MTKRRIALILVCLALVSIFFYSSMINAEHL
jgi:hypothetical protein